MNHLLYLFLKKTKLNKTLYKVYKNNAHEQIPIIPKEVEEAQISLNTLHPDPHNSCICQNQVATNPQYDLQIIVPAYNVEKYLKECLDSVLSQNTSFSYIVKVIDDGSTDDTSQILKAYQNQPHIEIIHQKNRGLSGARNTGLKEINARYLMFLDSDDKLAPGAIEAFMQMAKETHADIIEGSYIKFLDSWTTKRFQHTNSKDANKNALYGFAWGKIFKAELFAHIQFPEGYWFEDTICALVLHPMAKKVSTINHCVYCYRTNFKGISRNFRGKPKCLDSFYISRQLLSDIKALGWAMNEEQGIKIARQFRLNANRISSLNQENINRALFILQSNLFQKYFATIHSQDDLVVSLLNGDYKAFKLQMKWL